MIDTVTIYRRGARVRRAIPIETGASELKLAGLPLALDDGSVRLSVAGDTVRAVDVRVGVEVPPLDPALRPPRDEELLASEQAVSALRADVDRLGHALARLDALHIAPRPRPKRGTPPPASPADARRGLARLRSKEAERIAAELGARKAELRGAERKHAELVDRDERASNARNAQTHELRKTALVRLDGRAEPGATLYVEYLVPGACWSPAYTVWVEDDARVRVAMRALVAQRSGEDWSGAKIVLSTADPDAWVALPELTKLRIGRTQPRRPKRGWRAPPEGARELYADYDAVFGEPEPDLDELYTTVSAREAPADLGVMDSMSGMVGGEGAAPQAMPVASFAAPLAKRRMVAAPAPASRLSAGELDAADAVGSVMDAPARAGSPPPPGAAQLMYGALEEQAAAPELARAFELDVEAMAYGRLRMFGPSSERRGELALMGLAEIYAEGLEVSIDVGVAIRIALGRAEVDAGALPPGQRLPETPDAFDYAYASDVPADIPSDGAFHVVPVAEYALPATLRHVAVPREASDVFRLLEIECPDAALLAGPADVYEMKRGEYGYLMTTQVAPTAPRSKLTLGLGVEQAIKLSRNTTFAEQKTGLLGGGLALVHDIAIEVKNNAAGAAAIEVRECIPTKRRDDDDIEIAVGQVTPPWAPFDQDDTIEGGYAWKLHLAAGEATTLKASYAVRIAAKHQLVGGNRRES